jgi:hypothetical protein
LIFLKFSTKKAGTSIAIINGTDALIFNHAF